MNGEIARCLEILQRLAPGGKTFSVPEPLQSDESRWFALAISKAVVSFRECAQDCPRLRKWKVGGPDEFVSPNGGYRHLFSSPTAPNAWLNREYVPHIAAFARAVLELGYSQSQANFSYYRKFGRDLIVKQQGVSYETDVEFYDSEGTLYLQIEAKGRASQVATIVRQLDEASSLRELPPGTVKELEYVLDLAPRFLWIVGPGSIDPESHVYEVKVHELNAEFRKLEGLPGPP